MTKYNSPFYFALPRGARFADIDKARVHIAETFGVQGRAEVVRVAEDFALCRIVGVS